ncbi:hypothetical protein ACFLQN_04715, partial [Candidatus Aenigmatarchaeota archaeon]
WLYVVAESTATGIRFQGTDGTDTMTIENNGEVGIGFTSPSNKLHVNGITRIDNGYLYLNDDNTAYIRFHDNDYAGTYDNHYLIGRDGSLTVQANDGASSWPTTMALSPTRQYFPGPVGIGESSPDSDLHIVGGDNNGITASLQINTGATHKMLFDGNELDTNSALYINHNSGQNILLVDGGGNVGIGTASPSYELDVSGDVRATGDLISGDDVIAGDDVIFGYEQVSLTESDGLVAVGCSAGKKVLGGGCYCANGRIETSAYSGDFAWQCLCEPQSGTVTAYAICARVG